MSGLFFDGLELYNEHFDTFFKCHVVPIIVFSFRENPLAAQFKTWATEDRADQIGLRRSVNFIQMTLRFWLRHKPSDALVESSVDDQIGTYA